jgi:hypothetical protein
LLAQNVAATIPEAATQLPDGWLAVEYSSIAPYFLEALKEHLKNLKRLEESASEHATLEHTVEGLAARLKTTRIEKKGKSTIPPKQTKGRCAGKGMRLLWAAMLLGTLSIIAAISVILSINVQTKPDAPPFTLPTTFVGGNRIVNPGFEDPESNWIGNSSIALYSTFAAVPGFSDPPFDAGNKFMLFNSTSSIAISTSQQIRLSLVGKHTIVLGAWVFAIKAQQMPSFRTELSTVRFGVEVCFSSLEYSDIALNTWSNIQVNISCSFEDGDILIIGFTATAATVALDSVTIVDVPIQRVKAFLTDFSVSFPSIEPSSSWRIDSLSVRNDVAFSLISGVENSSRSDPCAIFRIPFTGLIGGDVQIQNISFVPFMESRASPSLSLDSSSRILVASTMLVEGKQKVPSIARRLSIGTIDESFGGNSGTVPLDLPSFSDGAAIRSLESSTGQILVLSMYKVPSSEFSLHRLTSSGQVESSFTTLLPSMNATVGDLITSNGTHFSVLANSSTVAVFNVTNAPTLAASRTFNGSITVVRTFPLSVRF